MGEPVLIVGAGPVGLATAMLLAATGREVLVLEKDATAPPATADSAWEWERRGVSQFRQAHYLQPRCRHLLEAELPAVLARLKDLGGMRFNVVDARLRSGGHGSRHQDDDRFDTLTARRPVLEAAFAQAAEDTIGVKIYRGISVQGPVMGPSSTNGIPHVVGLKTNKAKPIKAEFVVDARGRRSTLPEWVVALGGRPAYEAAADVGFAYYTRHYRSRGNGLPALRGPLAQYMATLGVLTLPADNNTWALGLIPVAGDKPFKALRHNPVFERVFRAFPNVAHWLDGEPLTDVMPMAGVLDRYRRIVVDGQPVTTGLVPVGDAWACTNPSAGRGITLGMMHAIALRDAVLAGDGRPTQTALEFDRLSEERVTPWYFDQLNRDHERAGRHRVEIAGGQPGPPRDPTAKLLAAARRDLDAARGALDVIGCLALPDEVMSRPSLKETLAQTGPPEPPAGPTRPDVLALL
jgi:2-polyprenyl-6-methoxyphenol hydroxylase-like FAD-dependent oxidoreductase